MFLVLVHITEGDDVVVVHLVEFSARLTEPRLGVFILPTSLACSSRKQHFYLYMNGVIIIIGQLVEIRYSLTTRVGESVQLGLAKGQRISPLFTPKKVSTLL